MVVVVVVTDVKVSVVVAVEVDVVDVVVVVTGELLLVLAAVRLNVVEVERDLTAGTAESRPCFHPVGDSWHHKKSILLRDLRKARMRHRLFCPVFIGRFIVPRVFSRGFAIFATLLTTCFGAAILAILRP